MLLNQPRGGHSTTATSARLAYAVDRETIAEKRLLRPVEPRAFPAPASLWWYDSKAGDVRCGFAC